MKTGRMVLMKKKLTSALIVSCLAAGLCATAGAADGDIAVKLNGEALKFDVAPVIKEGRTLVPFRTIFEALGCSVSYSPQKDGNFINAMKGGKYIGLEIGSNEMTVGGASVKLEVAPKIENGRTLVPLRAISEGLDLKVEWDGETNTVSITEKEGQYKIKAGHLSKIVSDTDGTPLINLDAAYPIIEGETDFVKQINKEYYDMAYEAVYDIADEISKDAGSLRIAMGDNFRPMEVSLSYEVMLNRNNMISIRMTNYAYFNGAHPSTTYRSRTFQMILEKELSLADVLDTDYDKACEIVSGAFGDYLKEIDDYGDIALNIKNKASNVSWYLTDDALMLYFNQYEVGPYAIGAPEAKIPYTGPSGTVKIDLSYVE